MKNLKILVAVILLGLMFTSSTVFARRGHLVDIGLTGGAIVVAVDWNDDGTWDEHFTFTSMAEAENFMAANDLQP